MILRKSVGAMDHEMHYGAAAPQKVRHGKAFARFVHPAILIVRADAKRWNVAQSCHQFGHEGDGAAAPVDAGRAFVTDFQRF